MKKSKLSKVSIALAQLELFPMMECYDFGHYKEQKKNRMLQQIKENNNILKKPGVEGQSPRKTTPISSGLRGISPQRKHGGEADKKAGISKMSAKTALITP